MKKTAIALLTALALSTSGVPMAFADTTPTTPPAVTQTQITANSSHATLKAQLQALKSLRNQEKTLDQQLRLQDKTTKNLVSQLKGSVNKSSLEAIKKVMATNKDIRINQIKPLMTKIRDLRGQLRSVTDKSQKATIRQQIKQLVAQAKQLQNQIKSNRQSVQADINAVRAQRVTFKQIFSATKSLRSNEKSEYAQLRSMKKQEHSLWLTGRSQIKAKDYTGALNTLNQITGLEQNVISTKQQILSTKQQVTAELQNIVTIQSAASQNSIPSNGASAS
ncbi:MAG: hypothetical protein M1609_00940 [Firmicutes bacterium]|nr:hypothetical protein [Bacillota bacterium]